MTRTFDDRPAVREQTPLLIGIVSPSGAGKTYSALRLATGVQRVAGGDIGVIDTEARRSLHYATKFKFRHLAFGAPFGPLDYLAAIEHFVKKGVTNIIVDSMSHEHEGPGGILEMHDAELDRIAGKTDFAKRERCNMLAWSKPKQQRRKLINAILQMNANFIFCFRAKEKIKLQPGKDPIALGFQAISGDEWIYEMQLKCLLLPGSDGVPTWQSEMPGEALTIKLPEQFRPFFAGGKQQLSEDIGQKLAEWAKGSPVTAIPTADELLKRYEACSDPKTLAALEIERGRAWASISAEDKKRLKAAVDDAGTRIAQAERKFDDTPVGDEPKATEADAQKTDENAA
jgi:hypothetical protein